MAQVGSTMAANSQIPTESVSQTNSTAISEFHCWRKQEQLESETSNRNNDLDQMKKYFIYTELPKVKVNEHRVSSCIVGNLIRFHFLLRLPENEAKALRMAPIKFFKPPVVNFAVIHQPFLCDKEAEGPIPKDSSSSPMINDKIDADDDNLDPQMAEEIKKFGKDPEGSQDNQTDGKEHTLASSDSIHPSGSVSALYSRGAQADNKGIDKLHSAKQKSDAEDEGVDGRQGRYSDQQFSRDVTPADEDEQRLREEAEGSESDGSGTRQQQKLKKADNSESGSTSLLISAGAPAKSPLRPKSDELQEGHLEGQQGQGHAPVGHEDENEEIDDEAGQIEDQLRRTSDGRKAYDLNEMDNELDQMGSQTGRMDGLGHMDSEMVQLDDLDQMRSQRDQEDDRGEQSLGQIGQPGSRISKERLKGHEGQSKEADGSEKKKTIKPKKYFLYCEIPLVKKNEHRVSSVTSSDKIHTHFLLKQPMNDQPLRLRPIRKYRRPRVNFAVIHKSLIVDEVAEGPIPKNKLSRNSPMICDKDDYDDDDDDGDGDDYDNRNSNSNNIRRAHFGFSLGQAPTSKYTLTSNWEIFTDSEGNRCPQVVIAKSADTNLAFCDE